MKHETLKHFYNILQMFYFILTQVHDLKCSRVTARMQMTCSGAVVKRYRQTAPEFYRSRHKPKPADTTRPTRASVTGGRTSLLTRQTSIFTCFCKLFQHNLLSPTITYGILQYKSTTYISLH